MRAEQACMCVCEREGWVENRGCDHAWSVSETKDLSCSWAENPPMRQCCGFCSRQPALLGQLGVDWGRTEILGRNTLKKFFFSRSFLRKSENSTAAFISCFPCKLKLASWCFELYNEVTDGARRPDGALVHPRAPLPSSPHPWKRRWERVAAFF